VTGTVPPTEPAPSRWSFSVLVLLLMVLLTGGGYLLGAVLGGGGTEAAPKTAQATVPETTTDHQSLGVTFHLPGTLTQTGAGSFADPDTGAVYTLSVELGATEEMAVDALLAPISQSRLRPDFSNFSLAYTGGEE